jgi:hypothetical protein
MVNELASFKYYVVLRDEWLFDLLHATQTLTQYMIATVLHFVLQNIYFFIITQKAKWSAESQNKNAVTPLAA